LIDSNLEHAGNVVSQQTAQVRDIASQHTAKGFEAVKGYTGEYANKAGEFVGQARQKIPSTAGVKSNDFPKAPEHDIKTETTAPEPVPAS
jgi:hypothetical protein